LLGFFASCDILNSSGSPVVARVKLRLLRQSDIENVLGNDPDPQQERDYIDRWISKQLWEIEAKKHHSPGRDIKKKVRDYRSSLVIKEYQENTLLNTIVISENDVIDYYENNPTEFQTREKAAVVRVYSLKSKAEAGTLLSKLKNNKDPLIEGYVKLVYPGTCIKSLDEKIFSKNNHDLLGPVESGNVYYVVSVLHRYPANSLLRVEHVRDGIIQKLRMSKYISAKQSKEKELKERINVKIFKNTDN